MIFDFVPTVWIRKGHFGMLGMGVRLGVATVVSLTIPVECRDIIILPAEEPGQPDALRSAEKRALPYAATSDTVPPPLLQTNAFC